MSNFEPYFFYKINTFYTPNATKWPGVIRPDYENWSTKNTNQNNKFSEPAHTQN